MLTLNFSPFPVLYSPRLILRCMTLADVPRLFILRSDKEVLKYLDRAPFQSAEETKIFIENIIDNIEKNEAILWVIALKEDAETLIGTIGFWRIQKEHYRAEIGYMLDKHYWQKGFMKEAIKASLDWAFTTTDIHSIEANINPGNEASAALLKSSGFVEEGYFKESYYYNGTFTDAAIYSLIKGNYSVT